MSVKVLGTGAKSAGSIELEGLLADQQIKPHLIHETVVAELAARRAGTHSTKTRALVRGGGSKPWRQKGTGRARAGSSRSPIWTGGGVTFGPHPRSYGGKVNRKIRAQAFRSALKAHVERESMAVLDELKWDAPSTKKAAEFLAKAPKSLEARPLLLVVDDVDSVVARSFRNLQDVYVLAAGEIETVDVMAGRSLLVERTAWDRISRIGERRPEAPATEAPEEAS